MTNRDPHLTPVPERAGIPANLDTWEPGPSLAAVLSSIDIEAISAADQVVVMRAFARMAAHIQAGLYRSMASIADAYRAQLTEEGIDDEALIHQATEAEIGAALHLTRRSAATELALAEDLRLRLPQVGEALTAGTIDPRRARVIIRETCHLPTEAAQEVADQVIEGAGELTTGQLGARVRRLAAEAAINQAEERFHQAVDDRRVVVDPTSDGTADLLIADISPERAMEASDHIERIARHLKSLPGETRSLDQIRADVASDLLRGESVDPNQTARSTAKGSGRVDIRVDLTTLAGLDQRPGELEGFGPVIADIARQVAIATRSWEFTVTHPDTGEVLHTGVTRRRPTSAQARRVRSRYPTCTFPGCRMPAVKCDLDHCHPHGEGGPTCPCNLAPLCRRHHVIRHRAGWTVEITRDGDLRWTSPLGHTYITRGRDP